MGKKSSSAPDYGPLAQASVESARIMAQLGREQLDFAKQQYRELKPVYKDITDRQLRIAEQTAKQGDEYYNYLKIFRPAERMLNYQGLGLSSSEIASLESLYNSNLASAVGSSSSSSSSSGSGGKGSQPPSYNSSGSGGKGSQPPSYNYNNQQNAYLTSLSNAAVNAAIRRQTELANMRAKDEADAAIIGGQDANVYNARKKEIDYKVNQAIADAQNAYSRAINQAIRQGLRYGTAISPQVGGLGLVQASKVASIANAARQAGIQQQRDLAQTNMALRRDIQHNIDKQRALDWARRLDAISIAKGLAGASQGAYGLAVGANDSAGKNAVVPGQQYMTGMAQGINTIAKGRELYQQGLSSILNAQAQVYAADSQRSDPFGTILGIGLGGWASGGFRF